MSAARGAPVRLPGRRARRHDGTTTPPPVQDTGSRLCAAPDLQVFLQPNGDVGPCCRNSAPYGNIAERSLSEIWAGRPRAAARHALAHGEFPLGCEQCAVEVDLVGRQASYVVEYDHWERVVGGVADGDWPRRIEFNLSNRCNLQCIQCSGEQSSAIRHHREKRPPLPERYDDAFFEDLAGFLPHLRHASFAGGEPFLARENFRVWDMLAGLPDPPACTIITNGTMWTPRVEAVVEALSPEVIVSLDGATPETTASVRVGSDHARVMANLDHFRAAAARYGGRVGINHCVMPQNLLELPAVLRQAEERGLSVHALIVLGPVEASLAQLPRSELSRLHEELLARSGGIDDDLELNRAPWQATLARIEGWLGRSGDDDRSAWTAATPSILQFRRQGRGPVDVEAVAARLAARAGGAPVHRVRIGPDEVTRGWPAPLLASLGVAPERLEGRPLGALLEVIDRFEVTHQDADGYDARFAVGGRRLHLSMVPARGADGWADEVVALFAFVDPGGEVVIR